VVSWQLYSKENLSPPGGDPALFRMKRFEAALDANVSHPVLLTKVSSRFLSSKRCLQHMKSFFSFHLQICALELHCLVVLWLKTKASMVDLALLLRLHIIFIGTFFFIPGKNTSLLIIINVFSSHVKMVLSKTNTSLMIYTKLSLMQQNAPS